MQTFYLFYEFLCFHWNETKRLFKHLHIFFFQFLSFLFFFISFNLFSFRRQSFFLWYDTVSARTLRYNSEVRELGRNSTKIFSLVLVSLFLRWNSLYGCIYHLHYESMKWKSYFVETETNIYLTKAYSIYPAISPSRNF